MTMLRRRRSTLTCLLAFLIFLAALLPTRAAALDNGLAQTPPMGWNSWNKFHCNINEHLIQQITDAIVSSGLSDAGYQYVIVDDCWSAATRDADGNLQASASAFPSGMKALGDYIHARGLLFGLYASIGTATCTGKTPGSLDNEDRDVQTFASWGVDYIKADRCNADGLDLPQIYARWTTAIAASGRSMVMSASDNGARQGPWSWGPAVANQWRTTGDIGDNFSRMLGNLDGNSRFPGATLPGGFNDPDMLEVGNGGMTDTEYRTHFGMWALMAAPLIAGNDVRSMSANDLAILTHPEVIALDQDPLAFQCIKVFDDGAGLQVWYRPLSGSGARAVGLLNRSDSDSDLTVNWTDIGLSAGSASVHDVWAQADLGYFIDSFSATVPAHGLTLLTIGGTDVPVVSGFLSDQPWTYVANGWSTAKRDQSVGGGSIQLSGVVFSKGLGVHVPSAIEIRPNGACSNFSATIGLDDEVGANGNADFQVWGDGTLLFDSGVMAGGAAAQSITVPIAGVNELRLQVTGGYSVMDFDHSDWAAAQVNCGQ